ncbi:MAG: bifunctional diguanylate cyclase/phosphodiesterase [Luteimonas sp.]
MGEIQGTAITHSRTVRLRRQTIALARAARAVLQSNDGFDAAFAALAPIAIEALSLQRLALWQFDGANTLTCLHAQGDGSVPISPGAQQCAPHWPTRHTRGSRAKQRGGQDDVRLVSVHGNAALLDPVWRDTLEREGVGSHIDAQLRVDDSIWGQLRFDCAKPRRWHVDETTLAGYFSDLMGVAIERSRRRDAEARLQYLSLYDSVSGAANRAMFHACLGQLLLRMRRRPRMAALLFIDIDRFFSVNEALGEAGGDTALSTLAERIDAATPDDAVLARVESDCFAVLLPSVQREWEASTQAEILLQRLAEPLAHGEHNVEISASIGIAFADAGSGTTAEEWLRDADLASKQAKAGGRNRVEVFDSDAHRTLVERLEVERALRQALREDRIEVAYQAEFDLESGEVVGAEALARWRLEDGRLLAAGEFIDVAEATGLIEPIGYRVLTRACIEASRWPTLASGRGRMVRVNISARQFAHAGLFEAVTAALQASGLTAACLCLEITETTLMQQAAASRNTLDQLHGLGVALAIDDFGTGYSSLAYLRRFPVHTLKLDKAMIDDLVSDESARAIVIAVRDLAAALSLEVVVEGVEHREQADVLRTLGLAHVQGFYFARPESAPAFFTRISSGDAESLSK